MFTRTSQLQSLRTIPLFAGLRDKELHTIDALMTEIVFPAGRTLIEEDGWGQEFFIVTSGTVSVQRDGTELAELGPGEFFGEMALLDGRPRSATVTTSTQVTAFVLGVREFTSLVHGHPTVSRNMLRHMAQRMRPAA